MSDAFYSFVRGIGTPIFRASSRPTILGLELTAREGPFIIAATHQSAYDVALLIRHSKRRLDFVSITEVFKNPIIAWFYSSMNAFPLDRSRRDPATVRTILHRLERGRVIAMFPEGGFRRGEQSVIHSRKIKSGIGRIAQIAKVPVIPCVIRDSLVYSKPASWLPIKRTRYGIAFGEPILPKNDPLVLESELVNAFITLDARLIENSSGKMFL